jgi:hypothetical protein
MFVGVVVGIGAEDLRDGVVHLVFGVLWQIIKQGARERCLFFFKKM